MRRSDAKGVPAGLRRAAIVVVVSLCAAAASALATDAVRTVTVYTRAGCPHCVEAHGFLDQLARERAGLSILEHDISEAGALDRLRELTARAGIPTPGVPTFVIDGTVLVGFDAEITPARIRALPGARRPAPSPSALARLLRRAARAARLAAAPGVA